MNDRPTKTPRRKSSAPTRPRDYAIGYCKPPVHTQFRKGVSGNPRGGPRGTTAARARELALKEAYRLVTVREGDKIMRLPIVQAVLRSQLALAVKGHSPAQRSALAAIHALEYDVALEAEAAREKAEAARPQRPLSNREIARQAAFMVAV